MGKNNITFLYEKDGSIEIVDNDYNVEQILIPRFYKIGTVYKGLFSYKTLFVDNNVQIPTSAVNMRQVYIDLGFIEQYFSKESIQIHKSLGVKNKLSYLFEGKQGTGKTTSAYVVADYLIKQFGAVCVTVKDIEELQCSVNFLKQSKEKKDFLSVIIFDECEKTMISHESVMKNILDSSDSIENHIFLFTTNYVDKIPDTIKNRPSRIREIITFKGIEDSIAVYEILKNMNQTMKEGYSLDENTINTLTTKLIGKTLDEIKTAYIDTSFMLKLKEAGLEKIIKTY